MKQTIKNHKKTCKQNKNNSGVSHIISTLLVSATLFTILIIASFVSINILNANIASTEFEQAKANMLLLDSTIQDVALRSSAGGYVEFNQREGGIGMEKTDQTLTIAATDGTNLKTATFNNLVQLVYRGSSMVTTAVDETGIQTLKGTSAPYVSQTEGLGWLRIAQDDGAKIKLDYNRVRIVSTGLIDTDTHLIQITFIRLEFGTISGAASGNVKVVVQNTETTTTAWTFENNPISISVRNPTSPNGRTLTITSPEGTQQTIVVLSEVTIKISIR